MIEAPHPEDIKAALRKRFGSIANFERERGLPERSVRDILRGKARAGIAQAVAVELGTNVQALFPGRYKVSHNGDISSRNRSAQLLNGEAA